MHTVTPWSHPECYVGATWEGWFSAGFGQSRDSDALEQSNFATAYETLKAFDTDLGRMRETSCIAPVIFCTNC